MRKEKDDAAEMPVDTSGDEGKVGGGNEAGKAGGNCSQLATVDGPPAWWAAAMQHERKATEEVVEGMLGRIMLKINAEVTEVKDAVKEVKAFAKKMMGTEVRPAQELSQTCLSACKTMSTLRGA